MEQNFQTSFIPQKPIIEKEVVQDKKPLSLFMVIAIIIFLSTALAYGGLFVFEISTNNSIKKYQDNLKLVKDRLEIEKINELGILDKKLVASTKILEQHISISPIFQALQSITMKSIRYTKFSYSISEKDEIFIKLSGEAEDYRSIALQADLFSSNKNLIEPVFSNLNLNEKSKVLFDLEFRVDAIFVNYKQKLDTERILPQNNNN